MEGRNRKAGGNLPQSPPNIEVVMRLPAVFHSPSGSLGRTMIAIRTPPRALDEPSAMSDAGESQASSTIGIDINQPHNVGLSTQERRAEGNRAPSKRRLRKIVMQIVGLIWASICLITGFSTSYFNERVDGTIVWGVLLTLTSSGVVLCSYIFQPRSRRHPNQLVMYHNLCALIFAIKILVVVLSQCAGSTCSPLGSSSCVTNITIEMFLLVAGETWYLAAVIDLYVSLTNPFANWAACSKLYHCFVWTASILISSLVFVTVKREENVGPCDVIHVLFSSEIDEVRKEELGKAPLGEEPIVSSFQSNEAAFWTIFMAMIGFVVLFSSFILALAWYRTRGGLSSVSKVRKQSLSQALYNVLITQIFWLGFFIASMVYLAEDQERANIFFYQVFSFFLAGRGFLSYSAWWYANDPIGWTCSLARLKKAQADYTPQINGPLRKEVIFFTLTGVKNALLSSVELDSSITVNELFISPPDQPWNDVALCSTPPGNRPCAPTDYVDSAPFSPLARKLSDKLANSEKRFLDFSPSEFRRVRTAFSVDDESYLHSLSRTKKARLSEGASGAFMFYSADGRLIVKSCSREERDHLHNTARDYAEFVEQNPHTFITRYYGCHSIFLYSQCFSFLVMANIFAIPKTIHARYDVKGSWVNRRATMPREGMVVTCRSCNVRYRYSGPRSRERKSSAMADSGRDGAGGGFFSPDGRRSEGLCPSLYPGVPDCINPRGHDPDIVLKDEDFFNRTPLHMDSTSRQVLLEQLTVDVEFLSAHGAMDYSLLIGVHNEDYVGTGETFLSAVADPTSSFSSSTLHRPASSASLPSAPRERAFTQTELWGTGPEYYCLGIIDVLQTWNIRKRAENCLKAYLCCKEQEGISAINPHAYARRFKNFIRQIILKENHSGNPLSEFTSASDFGKRSRRVSLKMGEEQKVREKEEGIRDVEVVGSPQMATAGAYLLHSTEI